MTIKYDPETHALIVFDAYDPEFETTALRCEDAMLCIVEDDLVQDYCGDPEDEEYDEEDFPGLDGLWNDYNSGTMSEETKKGISVVSMSEVIEFYLKNFKG